MNDVEDVQSVLVVDDERSIEWMEWSEDGQLLAVAAPTGTLHVYLSKLTILGDAYGTRLAFLSSLLEVTVVNVSEDLNDSVIIIRIDIEPSLVAIGPYHAAVAMNNRVWFYGLTGTETTLLLREREYVGIVKCLKLNGDYAAVFFTDGTVNLHLIETEHVGEDYANRDSKVFPDNVGGSVGNCKITSLCLTNEFLIYSTDKGSIEFFMLEDWTMVNVYRHTTGVKLISSDISGVRLAVIDDRNEAFIYNSVTDVIIEIPQDEFPANVRNILWESWSFDKGVFVAFDSKNIVIYAYTRNTIEGSKVEYVGKMKIPTGQFPLLLYNGVIVCQTQSGKTSNFVLTTHDFTEKMNDKDRLKKELLRDILKLRRFQDAWKICDYLNNEAAWQQMGKAVIYDLDVDLAIRVYRHIGNCGMVNTLVKFQPYEERNLVAAHLAMCLEEYDLAQQLFLKSSQPLEALEMRQSLLQWNEALLLARRLAPKQIPIISREFATQLEFTGDYSSALEHFEKGLIADDALSEPDTHKEHNELCKAGIARNAIRCGNTRRGIEYATHLSDRNLHLECAGILESMKLYSDAALLYEKAGDFNKSANLYLKVKNSSKVGEMLAKINDREIQIQFARSKENDGKYRDALKAYAKAEDWTNVVRLYLDHLNNPGEAVKIVKETQSVEGAKMIAKFFQR